MEALFTSFAESPVLLFGAIFAAAVTFFLFSAVLVMPFIETRRRVSAELLAEGFADRRSLEAQSELVRITARRPVEAYFKALEKERGEPDALEARLFRAGFYQKSAPAIYQLVRIGLVGAAFVGSYWVFSLIVPSQWPAFIVPAGAGLFSLGFVVIPSIALDRFEARQKERYRRGFPDFMDMMITCADAGMSLEAAVARVSHELAATHKALGVQLAIMALQVRAGKPLRSALHDLSERIAIDEARSLAVLFRQSEELGTSLTEALRVYSDEMRTQRILRAEEKANSLPVKMVIPLGLCVFPVVLMIVMLPVILRMRGVFF